MPRIARECLETSFFHVIVQGVNKEYIFYKKEYIESYISLLNKYKEDFKIEIIAYCIMNNHGHMLIYTEKISELSKFMHRVNAVYAQYYNEKENRVGHVFRDRYKSEAICSEGYLISCIKYIHQNPVRANMVKKCSEYEYSTYNEYLHGTGVAKNTILNKVIGKENYEALLELDETIICYDIDVTSGEIIDKITQNYTKERNIDINEILINKKEAKELIKILRETYGITYKQMQKKFKISERQLDSLKD